MKRQYNDPDVTDTGTRNSSSSKTVPTHVMILVFHKAPAVEKFKMLLSANKEWTRYIIKYATWAKYIRDEFNISDNTIKDDISHEKPSYSLPPGINFRWLYWAVAAYKSEASYETRMYWMYYGKNGSRRSRRPQNNDGFKVIISHTVWGLSIQVKVPENPSNKYILDTMRETIDEKIGAIMPVFSTREHSVEVYRPQGSLRVYSAYVEPVYHLSEVWILYTFLSLGYNVRLTDPEGDARENYYVRSNIACAQCFMPADQMCGQCMTTRYCSVECQQKHWHDGHSDTCG